MVKSLGCATSVGRDSAGVVLATEVAPWRPSREGACGATTPEGRGGAGGRAARLVAAAFLAQGSGPVQNGSVGAGLPPVAGGPGFEASPIRSPRWPPQPGRATVAAACRGAQAGRSGAAAEGRAIVVAPLGHLAAKKQSVVCFLHHNLHLVNYQLKKGLALMQQPTTKNKNPVSISRCTNFHFSNCNAMFNIFC